MTGHDFTCDRRVATVRATDVAAGLQRLGDFLEWSEVGRGPFGSAIPRGARVIVKPNWVLHENRGP